MARIGKEKKEEIRKSIIETSQRLFIEQGYDQTSTSQIAKEVGIAEGTLFNYFKKKSDLLLETFASDYLQVIEEEIHVDTSLGLVEIYRDYYQRGLNSLMRLPKKIALELFLTVLTITKKNPAMIKKFAAIDFKFLDGLEEITNQLIEKGLMKPCNARYFAEAIFGVIIYELTMFLYEKEYTKETMYRRIDEKIHFELEYRTR